jgi:hypothetical protein
MFTMCLAILRSSTSFFSSKITKKRSKRDIIGGEMLTLNFRGLERSYLPKVGLAAAKIEVLALSVAWIPALAIEIVYCSMASWIAV